MGKLVEIKTTKSSKGRIVPLGTPVETKMPETQIASPAMPKAPTMSQLQQQRQQAQVDMDMEAVNRIDNQMKALRAEQGKQTVLDRVGDATGAAAAGYLGNVSNALGTAAESLGIKEFAQKAKGLADVADEDAQKFNQNAKEGLGALGQFAVDAGIMGGQMAIDAAAGALIPFGGMTAMGLRTFGGGAKEARDAGATQGEQLAYGAGSAAIAMLTEKLANVSGMFKGTYGKGVLDKTISKLAAKPAGKLIVSALSEGGEEMLESALQPILQRLTYDPEAAYDEEWLAETLYSGAMGAVLGGVGGGVDVIGNNATETMQPEKPKAKEYVGAMPQNVKDPRITSPNLTAKKYLGPGEDIDLAYGNKYRKTVEQAAEERMGIGPNKPAYLVASNVTKDGEIYYAKITRESLGKMLYTEKNHRLPVERLVLVDNIEKAFDNSVWASSEGDRKNRPQINGFDRLRTSFYIDGKPYYADIVVKVVQQTKDQNSENVVYFLEPESIEAIKKVDTESPTLGRQAPKILFGETVSTNKTVPQETKTVKDPYNIIPNLAEMAETNKPAAPEVVQQQTAKDPYDIIPKLTDGVVMADTLPAKEKRHLQQRENETLRKLGKVLEVPVGVQREDLKPMVREMSEEYLKTGTISQKTVDDLFERAYEEGVKVDTTYYDEYKDIKHMLRTQPVSISQEDARNIQDYGAFRLAAFNTVNIKRDGTPVDVAYAQLSEMAPGLFPADITHPADQLMRMYEVGRSIQKVEKTLDDFYGPEAAEFKAWAKRDFEDAVNSFKSEMNWIKRAAVEKAQKQAKQMASTGEVRAAFEGIRAARKKADRVMAKHDITGEDETQIDRLLAGEITLKDIDPKRYNLKGIKEVYEAKTEYEQLSRTIREYKKLYKQKLRNEADKDLGNALNWKDKKSGLGYMRETMERNIEDIAPDSETAQKIIRKYFAPVHAKQAESTRAKNDYRDRVRKMDLSRKVEAGNVVSEAHAVQLLGEAESNIQMLQESTENNAMRDGKTLKEWQTIVTDLWAQNPKLDRQKIANAVDEFRRIYDELFEQMNEVRVRNGYEPVAYRKGYFPHFQPGETGLLADFGKALGITTDVTNLPTSINGLTHTFRPGITYFGNAKERLGFNTAYDAVEGFDKYIEGAADVIYQTDNIQRLRALAAQMRYRTTDEGIKKQVDNIRTNKNLTEEEQDAAVEKLFEDGRYELSRFVVELEEYTNLLANKKSRMDRGLEGAANRQVYNIAKALQGRVAANMVAVNPASWITNFIPLTQGALVLDSKHMLKGMWDTLKNYVESDGMVDVSTFLSNRKGSDPLVKTWVQNASTKASEPMEYIDSFTAGTLVRARYNQNLAKGLSAAEALYEADGWAARVMGDRSKGAMPTLFNQQNPLSKLFTQFQLEPNNQLSFFFKDLPKEMKEKGTEALIKSVLRFAISAFLFNEMFEHLTGRRPAADPLGMLNEAAGDLTGYELPNLIEMGAIAMDGGLSKEDFQTEKVGLGQATKNVAGNVAEQLPFMGVLNLAGADIDVGRLPVSSAIPDVKNLANALDETNNWAPEKRKQEIVEELAKPATYILPPFGGGQAKKIKQAIEANKRGGSYKVDSEGNQIMQYPVYTDENNLLDNVMLGIFGKSSTKEAKKWVESGFDSFNAKETAAYQGAVEAGAPQRTANDLLREMGSVQKTDAESAATLKRKILQKADISEEAKGVIFYSLLAGEKDLELADKVNERDLPGLAACMMQIKDANTLKDGTQGKKKLEAIRNARISDATKIEVYLDMKKEKLDELEEIAAAGLSIDDWLQFEIETSGLSTDGTTTKKEKVLQIINNLNITPEQKDALYYAADYSEKGIKDAPWHADPYDLVGNIMRGTTLKMPTIKMPEIKIPTLKF